MSTLATEKANFINVLTGILGDLDENKTTAQKAQELADAIESWINAAKVQVSIPTGTVVIAVTGGSGAPAVGVLNPAPIALFGEPASLPDTAGGIV